ncbi:hypothetical protein ACFFU1_14640 [Algibacter miyuki]|uniref:Uncharacterized protein n=1 Tax=Algibacter miyuki TaxID=1306933 RepID=A0ABV5H2W8_9FLAO|nr:hypothetical protein [Algibacter miyuki]MDN3665762.1 hypothetical protein [Algibacter miyuki]
MNYVINDRTNKKRYENVNLDYRTEIGNDIMHKNMTFRVEAIAIAIPEHGVIELICINRTNKPKQADLEVTYR